MTRYDDRAAFNTDTTTRTQIDFEGIRNACINLPEAGGLTVSGFNLNGGIARFLTTGSCAPTLTPWQGYVFMARLVIRPDVPAQAFITATPPVGTMAVGFDLGINDDPVTAKIEVCARPGKTRSLAIGNAVPYYRTGNKTSQTVLLLVA